MAQTNGIDPGILTQLKTFKGSDHYLADKELARALSIAYLLGKPLLVEGESGTGKTKLGEEAASVLGLEHILAPITSETKGLELCYTYDAVLRLTDAQLVAAGQGTERRRVDHIEDYITYGPVGRAFLSEKPVVLTLDEIDKAEREVPNNLLAILERREIYVKETGQTIPATHTPVIVITSNAEKELPSAFLGRCVYHYIDFPTQQRMWEIMKLHFPTISDQVLQTAIGVFYELRERRLERSPATRELRDWVQYLTANGITDRKRIEKLEGGQALIKRGVDWGTLREYWHGMKSALGGEDRRDQRHYREQPYR
ncbi:MoxR family ATPase [Candidatus Woesearchaeota archaeon]|nr:MoxR family ATPase [Candidatus Woesearchaeota archaeon]